MVYFQSNITILNKDYQGSVYMYPQHHFDLGLSPLAAADETKLHHYSLAHLSWLPKSLEAYPEIAAPALITSRGRAPTMPMES